MKTQLKIAVAVAVLSLAGTAVAGEYVDLGRAQQRGEEGQAPIVGEALTIPLDESAAPTSHQLGEAQQQAESGVGYTPASGTMNVAGAPKPTAEITPTFGIGEAQQLAESGEGYTPVAVSDVHALGDHVALGDVASIAQ
jgi:hypothetical protein